MSIFVILTIVFVVLRLTHTIFWSWWWVLSPLLAEVGLDLFLFFYVFKKSMSIFRMTKKMIAADDCPPFYDGGPRESAEDMVRRLTGPRSLDDMVKEAREKNERRSRP